jgi:DNA-binding NarL/FixJ family response regulator
MASRIFRLDTPIDRAEKKVDNHIQHIYIKAGVSTRAGATLFAMEHDLLAPVG